MNPKTHPKRYRRLRDGEPLREGDLYEIRGGFAETNGHFRKIKVGDSGYNLIYYRLTTMKKQPKIIEVGDYLVYKKGRNYVVANSWHYDDEGVVHIRYGDKRFDVYDADIEAEFPERQVKLLLPLFNLPTKIGTYDLEINEGSIEIGCTEIEEEDVKAVLKL